jgi:ribosomal protein L37AE/L43A
MSRWHPPIHCPKCGEELRLWLAVTEQWECIKCLWRGRNPAPANPDQGLPE